MNPITYVLTYWPPIVILLAGSGLVAFFLYLHLVRKADSVRWIAKYIFRNQLMSEKSAEALFDIATSFVVTVGGLWIILAIYYLTNKLIKLWQIYFSYLLA
jgi:hypothetical protein